MSKELEEDLIKSVDLKVSVNCCEGCKRKVLKALSIKGVLKTEIHPTLPRITVTGDVDVQTLVGKLAKRGKKAELWPLHPKPEKQAQMPGSIDKEIENSGAEKAREDDPREVSGSRDTDTSTSDKKKVEKALREDDHRKVSRSRDTDTRDKKKKVEKGRGGGHRKVSGPRDTDSTCGDEKVEKTERRGGGNGTGNVEASSILPTDTSSGSYQTVINWVANPNMMAASGAQAYYQMEPRPVLMNAYSVQPPPPPPPPCCHRHQHRYESPLYHHPAAPVQVTPPPCCDQYLPAYHYVSPMYHQNHHPTTAPVQSQQPTAFTDYFNDDNTLGCYVM